MMSAETYKHTTILTAGNSVRAEAVQEAWSKTPELLGASEIALCRELLAMHKATGEPSVEEVGQQMQEVFAQLPKNFAKKLRGDSDCTLAFLGMISSAAMGPSGLFIGRWIRSRGEEMFDPVRVIEIRCLVAGLIEDLREHRSAQTLATVRQIDQDEIGCSVNPREAGRPHLPYVIARRERRDNQ